MSTTTTPTNAPTTTPTNAPATPPSNSTRVEVSKLTHHAWASPRQDKNAGAKRLIGTVIGRANGIKQINMPNGDKYEGLRGQFEAVNAETGEVTMSGICYLPSGFHDGVLDQLRDDNTASVDFAYRVFSIPSQNPQGYSYAMEPLLEPRESDPLSELRKTAAGKNPKAIAAPKTDTKAAA